MSAATETVWDVLGRIPLPSRTGYGGPGRISRELTRFPVPRIIDFQRGVLELSDDALTWPVWEAADVIHRMPCSVDMFLDFRMWLIVQGRTVFEAAVAGPDSLADHPPIRALAAKTGTWTDDDFPHLQDLPGVAEMAFDRALRNLGGDPAEEAEHPPVFDGRPHEQLEEPVPPDFRMRPAVSRRCPRLVRLFGEPPAARPGR